MIIDNMMGMFIFASGSAAVMVAADQVVSTNQGSYEVMAATTLARNVFEDLRRRDPEEYLTLGMPKGQLGPLDAAGNPSASGRYYVTYSYERNIPHTGLNVVEISVYWVDKHGRRESVDFVSSVRNPRLRPYGIIRPWPGITDYMGSYGTCASGAALYTSSLDSTALASMASSSSSASTTLDGLPLVTTTPATTTTNNGVGNGGGDKFVDKKK